jgi:hypothetical protein
MDCRSRRGYFRLATDFMTRPAAKFSGHPTLLRSAQAANNPTGVSRVEKLELARFDDLGYYHGRGLELTTVLISVG